ncbi:4Fe-4S dicluster domain-containing protein [Desulfolithobacter sp.]
MEERRKFLVQGGALLLSAVGLKPVLAQQNSEETVRWGMIIDLNRCTGCQSCVIACKNRNQTTRNQFNTRVLTQEEIFTRGRGLLFTPVQCNQCNDPPCVASCRLDATFQLDNGVVVTDWDRCDGCGDCIAACPYEARFADPAYGNRVDKCDFCLDRLVAGGVPSCVEACGSGARLFGNLRNPAGEFARCLNDPRLTFRSSSQTSGAAVRYIPHQQTEKTIP